MCVGPAVSALTSCHTNWCFPSGALTKTCLNKTTQIVTVVVVVAAAAAVAVPPRGGS